MFSYREDFGGDWRICISSRCMQRVRMERCRRSATADDGRLHILSDYGRWDRSDHRYLLSIGAALFQPSGYEACAETYSEEAFWLLGSEGAKRFDALRISQRIAIDSLSRCGHLRDAVRKDTYLLPAVIRSELPAPATTSITIF